MTTNETIQGKALIVGANGGMGRAVAQASAGRACRAAPLILLCFRDVIRELRFQD